ncbi:hypothetical protein [Enterobacter sp. KBR-315C3_2022]
MKYAIIALVVSSAILAGCAPRYQPPEEAVMTRAAINGAAMKQAMDNA